MPALPPLPSHAALPTALKNLCRQVRCFVSTDLSIDTHGPLLLAVSGGADSLALLVLFVLLRRSLGCSLHVAHVDHGLRPESSDEAHMVRELCEHWRIPCHLRQADVRAHAASAKLGLEEAARELRYALLEETREHCGATWIVTGHHRGDLEEDMLMRLVRGASWPGLAGMSAVDPLRQLLRPLLLTPPQDLRDLLQHLSVPWAEDSSNADTRYTRNRVRHQLIPLLHAENPRFAEGVQQLWQAARDDAQYWEEVLHRLCEERGVAFTAATVTLPAALLETVHRAVRLRLYVRALRHLHRGQARAHTLHQLDAALTAGRGGTVFQLPGGVTANLQRGSIIFRLS